MGLVVALALGVFVRALPILGAAGAIGDGGLIHAMVEDIRESDAIPAVTSYNALDIPLVYPPAGPKVAAVVADTFALSSMDVLQWMPLLLSIGTLGAFAWLSARLLPPIAAVGATFIYALMPHAYDWVIAGGGLTRGFGLLAALLAMAVATRPPASRWREPVLVGLALGVAFLAHPQAAILGVLGCVVLSWRAPRAEWLRDAAIASVVAVAVLLPWLLRVADLHGLDALASPANRFEPLVGLARLGNLRFSGAPFMDVFAVAGAVGALVAVVRGPRRVPLLLLLVYLVGAGGGEFLAAVPWALLGGIGVAAIVELLAGARLPRPAVAATAGVALFLGLIASLGAAAEGSSKLHALSAAQIAAMEWVGENADAEARFIVPTAGVWGDDEVSEWLPALAERHSIGTVQGSEWLGRVAFEERLAIHNAIRDCAGSTAACYAALDPEAWLYVPKGQLGGPFSPGDCCPALRSTLEDAGYTVVHDGPGATIAAP